MHTLKLARTLVNQMLTQAQESPDTEICGLLGGRNNQAQHCYPISNQAQQPQRHYLMDPQQQIEAMRQMREAGDELVAIYHSHPTTAAIPSDTDLKEAQYPDAAYLIISLNTEGVLELAAFRIRQGQASQLQLELE